MKVTLEQSALLKAVSRAKGIVERRNTAPILSHLLIGSDPTTPNCLHIVGSDMDMETIVTVEAHFDRDGSCTAPAQVLTDIIRKLPDGSQVEMDYDQKDHRLILRSGRSRFSLSTLAAEDFPELSSEDFDTSITLPSAQLAAVFDTVRGTISLEETRYYLNGIFWHLAEGTFRGTTTDGHRLSLDSIPRTDDQGDAMPSVIIPRKAVTEILKLLDDVNTVTLNISETRIQCMVDGARLTSKVIDGTFPDYTRVIPANNPHHLRVDSAAFKAAIDRVSSIASDKTHTIKMTLTSDAVTLSAKDAEGDNAEEMLDTDQTQYQGPDLIVGVNARYLTGLIDSARVPRLCLSFADEGSPILITDAATQDHGSRRFVLMPCRV